ncbi:MAG: asparaginase [Lautropia sp.]
MTDTRTRPEHAGAVPPRTVALVTTGGTIVSTVDPATGLAMPALSGEQLVATLGALDRAGHARALEVHEVARVASPAIEPAHWVVLARTIQALLDRDDIAGVVLTHGTATLEETAWFLDLTLSGDKPVVVIGAQRNASAPDFDGPRNLANALKIVHCPQAPGKGVLVALNDHINAARECTKTHTTDVETFRSGEWGYVGSIVEDQVRFHRAPTRRQHLPLARATLEGTPLPAVEIVSMYAGAGGALVAAAADLGARGLVIQAVASGHVNGAMHDAIVGVLARGVPVVVSTRIPQGGTRAGYGFPGSSARLVEAGAVLAGDLSPWKARILLMLALQEGVPSLQRLRALYDDGSSSAI